MQNKNTMFPSKPPSYIKHAAKFGNSGAGVMTQLISKNPPRETFIVVTFLRAQVKKLSLSTLA